MFIKRAKSILAMLLMAALILVIPGCADNAGDEAATTDSAGGAALGKKEITIGYVTWDCATASSNVMKTVLEDAGYTVKLVDLTASLLYQGLAEGDVDAMTTAWLPVTHASYMEQVGDQVVDLGVNYSGARIGLAVPAYMDIDSIEDLDGSAAGGKIIGIDPGAGIMSATEEAIEAYDLNYELIDGSDATMVAALGDAIANQEEAIVTGWTPHWKFNRWDLKFLDDPKGIYGEAESIHTLVRQGLKEDSPEAYEILDKFAWADNEISEVMDMTADGMDAADSARTWVDANQDKVKQWLP